MSSSNLINLKNHRETLFGWVDFGQLKLQSGLLIDVAVKRSNLNVMRDFANALESPEREAGIFRQLEQAGGHPNLVRFHDAFNKDHVHWLVLERCTGGELFEMLDTVRGKGMGEAVAANLFVQLVRAIEFLHAHNVVHLDISPENLMLGADKKLRVIDLGLALSIDGTNGVFPAHSVPRGKISYMAPEIFAGQQYDGRAADIWSAGVVLFLMLYGHPPYEVPTIRQDKRFALIFNGRMRDLLQHWGVLHRVSQSACDLVQQMLSPASQRPSLEQVLKHPWVKAELDRQAAEVAAAAALANASNSTTPRAADASVSTSAPSTPVRASGEAKSAADDESSNNSICTPAPSPSSASVASAAVAGSSSNRPASTSVSASASSSASSSAAAALPASSRSSNASSSSV